MKASIRPWKMALEALKISTNDVKSLSEELEVWKQILG